MHFPFIPTSNIFCRNLQMLLGCSNRFYVFLHIVKSESATVIHALSGVTVIAGDVGTIPVAQTGKSGLCHSY